MQFEMHPIFGCHGFTSAWGSVPKNERMHLSFPSLVPSPNDVAKTSSSPVRLPRVTHLLMLVSRAEAVPCSVQPRTSPGCGEKKGVEVKRSIQLMSQMIRSFCVRDTDDL